MIEGEEEGVKGVFGLEDGFAVKVEGEVEHAPGTEVGEEVREGAGEIEEVEDGVDEEEVERGGGDFGREGKEIGEEEGGGGRDK
jgi:hypothetical protein